VQRKVLTPNDFPNLDVLAERLLDFQYYWESTAQPFNWKFTRGSQGTSQQVPPAHHADGTRMNSEYTSAYL
jgi:hypothetical protein